MHKEFLDMISAIELTGDLQNDVLNFMSVKGNEDLVEHTTKVAYEAKNIARRYEVCEEKAFTAGLLHDIGRLIPLQISVDICDAYGVHVCQEEKLYPSILHGKISRIIASNIFNVDTDICNAIECHSTLRANVNKLDLILFIADKISWESAYNGEFIDEMMTGLDISLECSAIKFINYLRNGHAVVLHPWALEAYEYLRDI